MDLVYADADSLWYDLATRFQKAEGIAGQDSRAGKTMEILNAQLTLRDPRQRWVLSRRPAINPAFSLAEVVWIVTGRRDLAFLQNWNSRYSEFSDDGTSLHGAYGHRLRYSLGLDQLDRAFTTLRANPDSRQVVLQVWDPRADMPGDDGTPSSMDIPCNVCALLKVRDGRLHWMQVMRSNDMFLGLPQNIIQWTSLQEILAGWIGVGIGEYVHVAHSLHVYEKDICSLPSSCEPCLSPNTDNLCLNRQESDYWFANMESRILELGSTRTLDEEKIVELSATEGAPLAISNTMAVFGAEAARKRRYYDLVEEIMDRCTNPALSQAWANWMDRWHGAERSA